jgi:tetratricopeptide (TPR) repeat protein/transglutaminase-like putative cysteine protease
MAFPLPRTALSLLLAFVPAAASAATAMTDWPVARGPSHEPAPFRYDPGLVKKLPRSFLEDAAACTLYSGNTYLVEADGTVEAISHEIVRFNGRKGIEKLGEYRSISYDPAYQKLTLNEARVLKPDGRRVDIEPKHVQLRDLSTDYQVYDHDKQLIISFPNLEVGDAIEVKWTTRGKNPEYQGHFFNRYTFGDDKYPVALDELRVRVPRAMTLRYASVNGKVEPVIREDAGHRLYHWQVTNRPELPQDENLPTREEFRLQVVVSTFASWDEVGRWKQGLRAGCWKCTADIDRIVREVTQGLTRPEDRARALTYWIRRHIRYVSLGAVAHDYKPHPPATVLANRYGDCKDTAQLLAVMLRAAGLDVGLVTLGAQDDGQIVPAVPSPWGSHAILLVTIGGKHHWIDTTVSLAPWDYLPRDDRDRVVYVTGPSPDDSPTKAKQANARNIRLMRTPRLTADENRTEQTTLVTVAANGTSTSRRKMVFHGVAAVNQREAWADVPAGERRRVVSGQLQDSNSRAHLRRLTVYDKSLRNLSQDVVAGMEFDIPGHFTGTPELEGSVSDSRIWGKLLSYTLDYDRRAPLDLGAPFESIHRYIIRLPAALGFETLPKDQTVRSKWGSFQLAVLADPKDPRLFALEFRTRLDRTRVEPAEFDLFRQFHAEVNKNWRAWFNLKPTQDIADAGALEVLRVADPDDAASAAVLARLYCANDRLADARRVLNWARYLHPNDAQLWDLTVRAAASLADEEAAYRQMVRRFPTDLKYAVALGATLVKRGDLAGARKVLVPLTRQDQAPVRAASHYQLARAAWLRDDAATALDHWEAAAKTDMESIQTAVAWRFKGQLYEKLGRARDAVGAYQQALKADAESDDALRALVRLELAAGRRAEALDHLRRYTLVVNGDLQGMVSAADYHLALDRLEDAFDLASRALEIRFDMQAQRVLGLVYLRRGDWQHALAALLRAEKTPEVREGVMRSALALGRLEEVFRQAKDAQAVEKVPPQLQKILGLVARLRQRRDDLLKELRLPANKVEAGVRAADALVSAEIAHDQGRPARDVAGLLQPAFTCGVYLGPAYALRALLALEQGRLGKALADADKAITLGPPEARAYWVRGQVRFERATDGALDDLTRAAALSHRKDGLILHALAAAQLRAGHRAEALATQREAVKLCPKDTDLQEQLKEIERAK